MNGAPGESIPGSPLDASALLLIDGYRRYVSPRKGYRCAYHAATGRGSCSCYARRAIERRGLLQGLLLLRRRFRRCALAAAMYEESTVRADSEKFFGRCDPAVQEFRKLCCSRSWFDGLSDLGD